MNRGFVHAFLPLTDHVNTAEALDQHQHQNVCLQESAQPIATVPLGERLLGYVQRLAEAEAQK